jgi:hypothetical protein
MLWLDHLVIVADGKALGFGQGLLEFCRQFVEAHCGSLSEIVRCRIGGAATADFKSSSGKWRD